MTSANMDNANVANVDPTVDTDPLKGSVGAFNDLNVDERLAALALIYQEVAGSISADQLGTPSSTITELIRKIEQIPQDDQVRALHDLFTAGGDEEGEVVLDPHPSQALKELATGGGEKIPVEEYNSLDAQAKLIFWYHAAQKLGKGIVGIPSDFSPSSQTTDFLNLFKSLNEEQRINFLKQVV